MFLNEVTEIPSNEKKFRMVKNSQIFSVKIRRIVDYDRPLVLIYKWELQNQFTMQA